MRWCHRPPWTPRSRHGAARGSARCVPPRHRRLRAPAPGQYRARSLNRHSGLRHLPPARLCLACASAADSCWVLTPSERAAAANADDDVSAWPAANSGWSAALTRAALTCSSPATTATIASWPGFSLADVVCAGAPGLPPVADATAAVLSAARAAVTAAAAAIILVRLRMRILLGFVACTQGNQAGLRLTEEDPYRGLRSSAAARPGHLPARLRLASRPLTCAPTATRTRKPTA